MPNKIILPFYKELSIIQWQIRKLSRFEELKVIVATSSDKQNDKLEQLLIEEGVSYFRGDENDVLKRFIEAAEYYHIDQIIRVCSDNPFLDEQSIEQLLFKIQNTNADYMSFIVNGTPSIKTHFGFWTEYVTLETMKKVATITTDPYYREHVTNYIYEHPSNFVIRWLPVSNLLNNRFDIRLTIDTQSDFDRVKQIFGDLYGDSTLTIEKIIAYLDAHPLYLKEMKLEIKNQKK
jgi:spore coat polysaccharide biosynthesis protein SpsF